MKTRRSFLKCLALLPLATSATFAWAQQKAWQWVNDVHSKLNRTRVAEILEPSNHSEAARIVQQAAQKGQNISICGGRHAMGTQQFGTDTQLIDTRQLTRVLSLDTTSGIVEVESGIQWPELISELHKRQKSYPQPWTIAQKQTGADRLTVGGALAANAHSRGLTMRPIISDVESFQIINAAGETKECSRSQNSELFSLAIGGYGLFGLITTVKLRLMRRQKLERKVEFLNIAQVMPNFDAAIGSGALYGDFQFSIDPHSENFLQEGVFSTYHSVDPLIPIPEDNLRLDPSSWDQLLRLAHTDKAGAFQLYKDFYLKTDGQLYWSDEHQMSYYSDDYHQRINSHLDCQHQGSEMITEIYVPRDHLTDFMAEASKYLRESEADVIYGTVRLIDRDEESYLSWAKQSYACIIFNLHVTHTEAAIEKAAAAFRGLIDLAIKSDGSYYLTYHKWAKKSQLESCYPQFNTFMEMKRSYDPSEVFQSDWYRHNRDLLNS